MEPDRETVAQLVVESMADAIRGVPADQARKRAYVYGSESHHQLLRLGFQEDRSTSIIQLVLATVFATHLLGLPVDVESLAMARRQLEQELN